MSNTCISNDFNITVIQGDDFEMIYQFMDCDGNILDDTSITNVYMSCDKLEYQTNLVWNTTYQGWMLTILNELTTNFAQCVTTYDLTVYFLNSKIQTEIYEAKMTVLLKRNKVITSE